MTTPRGVTAGEEAKKEAPAVKLHSITPVLVLRA
jgi:hypothetical protein